jgi:hypothetical protein
MVIIPGMFMAGARQGRLATSVNLQNTTFLFGGNTTFSDCRYNPMSRPDSDVVAAAI